MRSERHSSTIHLNLTGKDDLTKVNVIRIFNVMHHLNFFVNADGMRMPKSTLFAALSTAFNCPELNEWENSLYTSRSKANSDHSAQKKNLREDEAKPEKILQGGRKRDARNLQQTSQRARSHPQRKRREKETEKVAPTPTPPPHNGGGFRHSRCSLTVHRFRHR